MTTKYHVPVLEQFEWQPAVLDQKTAPVGGESKGARYLVIATATGDFAGHAKSIAYYDGANWQFIVPKEGMRVRDLDSHDNLEYDGSAWNAIVVGSGDMEKSTYDTDNDGTVNSADTATTAAGLDDGGGNTLSAAEGQTAYDSRAVYVADYGQIEFEL